LPLPSGSAERQGGKQLSYISQLKQQQRWGEGGWENSGEGKQEDVSPRYDSTLPIIPQKKNSPRGKKLERSKHE